MQIHQLKPNPKWRNKKRVGRGGSKGTYSGRGLKGQNSRAGRKLQPIIRNIIKRYPKLRGYDFTPSSRRPIIVNLSKIEKKFEDGAKITPQALVEKRIIKNFLQRMPKVKILGTGEMKKKFVFENCLVSKSAKEKIEKAGGEVILKEVVIKEKPKKRKKTKPAEKAEEKPVEKKKEVIKKPVVKKTAKPKDKK